MANSITHVLPYPVKHARFSVVMSFNTSAGTPTDPTTPDTELSTDGGATFSDIAEEITTGGSNGMGYVTLTGAEMNNTSLALAFKSANCVTSRATIVPRDFPIIATGTLSAGDPTGGTLGTILTYDITGCFIRTTGGTGGGGTGGANNQARQIDTYNTSNGVFTCAAWAVQPDNTTTYDILMTPIAAGIVPADVKKWLGSTAPGSAGTLPAVTVSSIGSGVIDAGSIATNALTSTKFADAFFTAAKFAANALDAVWSTSSRTLTANTNLSIPTVAQIATAVWTDTTGSDFTTALSIGKSLYTGGAAPGAANGLAIVGSQMGLTTDITDALTDIFNWTSNVNSRIGSALTITDGKVDVNTLPDPAPNGYGGGTGSGTTSKIVVTRAS